MSTPRRHPTVLIPGFFGGQLSLRPFRHELVRRGVDADNWSRAPTLYRQPIHDHGRRLAEDLLDLRRRAGEPLTLVGWSEGGLVGISAMIQMSCVTTLRASDVVRRIITFGTPFHGSVPAYLGAIIDPLLGTNIHEMRPGSRTLAHHVRRLHAERDWDFQAVFGTRDWLVRSHQPHLAPQWCHYGPWEHRSLLYDQDLFRLIHRLILRP